MNSIVFVGLLAILGTVSARSSYDVALNQRNIFENEINNIVNAIADVLGLFDPIHVERAQLHLVGYYGIIENLKVDGFSNFYASHIKLSGLTTWNFELVLESPHTSASIEKWEIDGHSIYGLGAVKAVIHDYKLRLSAKIDILKLAVTDVEVIPSIGNASVSITGIKNDEELSREISDEINKFLNETVNSTEWHRQLSALVQAVIDNILGLILG